MRRIIKTDDPEWPKGLSEIEPLGSPDQLRADGLPLPNDARLQSWAPASSRSPASGTEP
jgi:hypothetical protein